MISKDLTEFWHESDRLRDKIGGRIFEPVAPQDQRRPYVVIEMIASDPAYNLVNQEPCEVETIQVDVFADRSSEADEIANLIRMRTNSYRGMMGETYVHGVTKERDDKSPVLRSDGGGWIYNRSIDYRLTYEVTPPDWE